MRVKLDEDVPLRVRALLAEHGHQAVTVREEGLGGASDPEVLRAARAEGRMLLTLDLGFADIRHYPPGQHPGIVVVRLQDQRAAHVEAVVREFLGAYARGAALVADWAPKQRTLPAGAVAVLQTIDRERVVRERCRLRRLRRIEPDR